jgi:hypothetical protein
VGASLSACLSGVGWSGGCWNVKFSVRGQAAVLGRFSEELEAARCFNMVSLLRDKEEAVLNVLDPAYAGGAASGDDGR